MANDLTTTDPQTTALATPWCEPPLTEKLAGLLAAKRIWTAGEPLPALSGEDRASAERAVAIYEAHPKGCSETVIDRQLTILSTAYPAARLSDDEAEARLEVYVAGLRDIDQDQLRRAVAEVVKTSRFFPSVAEIREQAGKLPAPARVYRASQLRRLLFAQPAPTISDPVGSEQVAELLASMQPDAPARTDRMPTAAYSRSEPTVADYMALGLDEEEAFTAWADYQKLKAAPPAGALPSSLAA